MGPIQTCHMFLNFYFFNIFWIWNLSMFSFSNLFYFMWYGNEECLHLYNLCCKVQSWILCSYIAMLLWFDNIYKSLYLVDAIKNEVLICKKHNEKNSWRWNPLSDEKCISSMFELFECNELTLYSNKCFGSSNIQCDIIFFMLCKMVLQFFQY